MILSHIVATDEKQAIGKNNGLLWHLPDDFKWFVKHTKGKAVIMGRKTMESLPGPLKNRLNIVISRKPIKKDGFVYAANPQAAIALAEQAGENEIFIIGGAQIYAETTAQIHRLYLTLVHHTFPDADTFYTLPNLKDFQLIHSEKHEADEKHPWPFTFLIYEK